MVTRILPPEEWPRLAGTEAAAVWPHLDPGVARVLVVEREQQIVACWVLTPVFHVECLWVSPEERAKTSVARRLWLGMGQLLSALQVRRVMTAATSESVRKLLAHAGAEKLPGDHYVMTFGGV